MVVRRRTPKAEPIHSSSFRLGDLVSGHSFRQLSQLACRAGTVVLRCYIVPHVRLNEVLADPQPSGIQIAKIVLRIAITLLSCHMVPLRCFGIVPRDSQAVCVRKSETLLRQRMSLQPGLLVVGNSFFEPLSLVGAARELKLKAWMVGISFQRQLAGFDSSRGVDIFERHTDYAGWKQSVGRVGCERITIRRPNRSLFGDLRRRLPRPVSSVEGVAASLEGGTLTVTGPAGQHTSAALLPIELPGVTFADFSAVVEDGRFRATARISIKPGNSLGKPMAIRGIVALGTRLDDPSYRFDIPVGEQRNSGSKGALP